MCELQKINYKVSLVTKTSLKMTQKNQKVQKKRKKIQEEIKY